VNSFFLLIAIVLVSLWLVPLLLIIVEVLHFFGVLGWKVPADPKAKTRQKLRVVKGGRDEKI
jgi:hypothetical protein